MDITFDALIEKQYGMPITVHFISIGCAANINCITDKIINLENKMNQQMAPFLQKFKTEHPKIQLNLILIDPNLEQPPYCVRSNILPTPDKLADGWENDLIFKNVYHERKSLISVYTFNNYVTYVTDNMKTDKYIDITDFLNKYNELCIKNNHILFVHDFSGKYISKLADYYDAVLSKFGCLNRIMYDISLRTDGGCYLNLTNPINIPIIQKNGNILEIFNPYSFNDHKLLEIYNSINKDTIGLIIREQIRTCISNKFKVLKDYIVTIYRRVLTLYKYDNKEIKISINDEDFDYINFKYKIKCNELFRNKKYCELLDVLLKIIIKEITNLLEIMHGKNSNPKIQKFIFEISTIENPYKLIDAMNIEFKKCMDEVFI
ncbi:MAG: putative orfan [Edafosvirus sp.]|uniref:Putative orfan n=1 Tax=Edafosvirus sp. TaxID=2487765 RepID=A0A3G4ZVN7_9VIRU|nr:MAG: putative orfan [Edafosvirus sp.]